MRMIITVTLVLVAFTARAVTLVENGQARCVIFAPPEVMAPDVKPAPTKFAAAEAERQRVRLRESVRDLADYLGRMSGATIEVLTAAPPAKDARLPIFVGARAAENFGAPAKSAPYKQGFRVVVSPKGIGLIGESDLATSYAIYEILDRLGCRWYMPGDLGEVVPELKTIALPEMTFDSAPSTIYRGVWYADDAYRRRNRHGGLQLSAGHALEFYVSKEERQQHPDWVAEIGGKPTTGNRLKWSSESLADALAQKLLKGQAADPHPSDSLSPDDGAEWDESAADRALDAGDVDPTMNAVSKTDRLLVLCNRIAERVSVKHPDVLFGMLAYVDYTRPPVREKVHPNIVPQLAPITYSRAHPMTDDRVPGNKELRYLVEGWGKRARMTSMYFYGWFLAETSAPNPMIAKWSTDVPIVFANNCQFWQPETVPNFETTMHALYLGCRLAWDSSQKPADVIAELNGRFYGAAAKEMTAYWKFIDDVWTQTPEYSGCGFGYMRRWTPERMAEARQLLNAAATACKTPMERRRVEIADESLKQFEVFMKLRRDQAEGRFAGLAEEGRKWMARSEELADRYKANYAFTRVPYSKKTTHAAYFEQFYQRTYESASRIAKEQRILSTPPLRTFRYQVDPEKKGEALGYAKGEFEDSAWKSTDVCVETWSSIGLHDYYKSVWCRTSVDVPAVTAGNKVRLWVGSTDGVVKVFVNGQHVPFVDEKGKSAAEASGYCTPFTFDVTAALKPGQKNTIALLCTRTGLNELGTGGLLAPAVLYADK